VVCWRDVVEEGVTRPLVCISAVILDDYIFTHLKWVWAHLYLCPIPYYFRY